ncbi:MAG: DNA-formamidopyrimidine glycosylase family protein [Gammaproteobacteria bacterium]
MPEGDTIHKIAGFLAPRLAGQVVRGLETPARTGKRPPESRGGERRLGRDRKILAVAARGKHLFIEFDDDTALRSHLGMYGSWHFYGHGESWRKPAWQASLVLETDHAVYVCFNAKEVEWVRRPSVRGRVLDTRLGPDLTAGGVNLEAVVRRARDIMEPDAPLADVLLDQRVACGIGNVYKSEVLFLRRHAPLTQLATVDDTRLAACYALASELLGRNLGGGRRVTRFENDAAGRLWVYGRGGSPCLRCDGVIVQVRLGRHHRSTYWCDRCQAAPADAGPGDVQSPD